MESLENIITNANENTKNMLAATAATNSIFDIDAKRNEIAQSPIYRPKQKKELIANLNQEYAKLYGLTKDIKNDEVITDAFNKYIKGDHSVEPLLKYHTHNLLQKALENTDVAYKAKEILANQMFPNKQANNDFNYAQFSDSQKSAINEYVSVGKLNGIIDKISVAAKHQHQEGASDIINQHSNILKDVITEFGGEADIELLPYILQNKKLASIYGAILDSIADGAIATHDNKTKLVSDEILEDKAYTMGQAAEQVLA